MKNIWNFVTKHRSRIVEIKITLNRFAQLGSQKKEQFRKEVWNIFAFFSFLLLYLTFQKYQKILGIVSMPTLKIIQIETTNYRKYIFRFDLNLLMHFLFLLSLYVCTLINTSIKIEYKNLRRWQSFANHPKNCPSALCKPT